MTTVKRPDGAEIVYHSSGTDSTHPALVFAHGWCSNHASWEHQIRYFANQHRVIALDRRGHGESTTSGTGHDPMGHASDIAAVIEDAGLTDVIVVGHAGGCPGVMELLRTYPALVRAGVIVDAYLYPQVNANDPDSLFGAFFGNIIDGLQGPDADEKFRECYTAFFGASLNDETIRGIVDDAAQTPNAVKIAEIEGLLVDLAEIARGITQPVLWLMGSFLHEAQNREYLVANLRDVGFAEVFGSGHFPHVEQPAQVNAAIAAFIEQL